MAKKRSAQRAPAARLDRFGTHKAFIANHLAAIVSGPKGSLAAGVLWFVLWDIADGRTGAVRGATVSRLATMCGLSRLTIRKSLACLVAAGLVVPDPHRSSVFSLLHVHRDECVEGGK